MFLKKIWEVFTIAAGALMGVLAHPRDIFENWSKDIFTWPGHGGLR